MKIIILSAFLIFCSFFARGQNTVDSLLGIWQDEGLENDVRVEALNKVCTQNYLLSHPDSAFILAQLSYEFSNKNNLQHQAASALSYLGQASRYAGKYKEAIDFQNRSISISEKINDSLGILKSTNSLGNIYLAKSDYPKAIDCYRDSYELAKELGNKKRMAFAQNNIGLVYFDLNDLDIALYYLKNALTLLAELGEDGVTSNTLINIGTIYRFKNDFDTALDFYNQSLAIKQKLNQKNGVAICYSNLGLIKWALGQKEKALQYFNQSLLLHQEAGNKKGIAHCLINFGKIYKETKIDSSIILVRNALNLAKETGDLEELSQAAELLSEIYQIKNQNKLAFEMYKLFRETQDTILSLKNHKAIALSELKFNKNQNTLEQELLVEKKIREGQLCFQKERFLYLLTFLATIYMVVSYFKKRSRNNKTERQDLLHRIDVLKERLASQTVSVSQKQKEYLRLNKDNIEKSINTKLGESSWMILNIIFENPSISNKEIAEKVNLSLEGVSSSLRRMYSSFNIKSSSNKKITLIREAVRLSIED